MVGFSRLFLHHDKTNTPRWARTPLWCVGTLSGEMTLSFIHILASLLKRGLLCKEGISLLEQILSFKS